MFSEIFLFRYVTAKTFDAYSWQTLETKCRFIFQVLNNSHGGRDVEDAAMGALSYSEVKALASGNPVVMEKAGLESDVARLRMLWRSHVDDQYSLRSRLARSNENLPIAKAKLPKLEMDLASVISKGEFSAQIGQSVFDNRKEAGESVQRAILRLQENAKFDTQYVSIGSYRGLSLVVGSGLGHFPKLYLYGKTYHFINASDNPVGMWATLDTYLDRVLVSEVEKLKSDILIYERDLLVLGNRIGRPFEHSDELEEKESRLKQINQTLELGARMQVACVESVTPDTLPIAADEVDAMEEMAEA